MTITPRDENGDPLDSFEGCELVTEDGTPVKEWLALADYWMSFRTGESGLPEIPAMYSEPQNRKVSYAEGGISRIDNPGRVTLLVLGGGVAIVILVLALISLIQAVFARRKAKRAKGRT